MPRSKNNVAAKQRHKKVLKATKGQFGTKHKLYRRANEALMKSRWYAHRDRRNRKREFRALWITRVGAACRERGMSYSVFMHGLAKAGVALNRKMLSEIAIADLAGFDALVALAKG